MAKLVALLQLAPSLMAADFDNSKTLLLGTSGFGDRSNPLANPAAMVERDYFQLSLSSYHRPGNLLGGQYLGIVAPIKSWQTEKVVSAGVFGDWAGDNSGLNPKLDFRGLERTYQLGYAFRMPHNLPFSHQLALGVNGFWNQFGRNPDSPERNWGMDAGLHWNPWYSSRKGELYLDAALLNLLSPYGVDAGDGQRRRTLPLDLNASALWRSPMRDLVLYAGLLVEDIDDESVPGQDTIPLAVLPGIPSAIGNWSWVTTRWDFPRWGALIGCSKAASCKSWRSTPGSHMAWFRSSWSGASSRERTTGFFSRATAA